MPSQHHQQQRQPSARSKPPQVRHPSILDANTEQPPAAPRRLSSSQRRDSSRGSITSRTSTTPPPTLIGRSGSVRSANAPPPSYPAPRPSVSTGARRPTGGLHRQNTLQTRYMDMLLSLDTIPRIHNILASFFGWLLLAGYVVFPGTFSSLSSSLDEDSSSAAEAEASRILNSVQNMPLLIIASVCCGIAIAGLLWLSFLWRKNYVWLLNRIYLPCATNSLAGLISSLVTVYTQKDGAWSVMAKVTAAVEAGAFVVCGVLFAVNTLMLKIVKRRHGKEMDRWDRQEEPQGDIGLFEKAGRKLNQPAVEPQSVV